MIELCWGILFLGIAAACNWLMGIFDKVGIQKVTWDWRQFIGGLIKICIIVGCIIGVGFIWEYSGVDVSAAGIEPLTLTTTATGYYAIKAILHLKDILVDSKKTEEV